MAGVTGIRQVRMTESPDLTMASGPEYSARSISDFYNGCQYRSRQWRNSKQNC
jgi:hypothetical protein